MTKRACARPPCRFAPRHPRGARADAGFALCAPLCACGESGARGGSTFEFAWFRLSEKSAQAHHGGRISCKTSTCRLPAVWVWVFQANIGFEGVLGYL